MYGSNFSAVSVGLIVDPDPGFSVPVVVEVTPETPGAAFRLSPGPVSPGFDGAWLESVHVIQEVAIVELSKFGVKTIVVFADSVSGIVAVNSQTLEWVSHNQNTTSPWVVKTAVWVGCVFGTVGLVKVVWSVQRFVVQNTKQWKSCCACCVSVLGVASVASHLAYPMVLLAWPLYCSVCGTLADWKHLRSVVGACVAPFLCHAQGQHGHKHNKGFAHCLDLGYQNIYKVKKLLRTYILNQPCFSCWFYLFYPVIYCLDSTKSNLSLLFFSTLFICKFFA